MPVYGITIVIILITSSCKKENDPLPTSQSFVGKTYQIVSFTLNPALDLDNDGIADTDLTLLFSDCRKDDTVTFETGGKILTGFGTSKCTGDDTSDRNGGTWTYDQSRNVLKTLDKDDPTVITEWAIEASGNTLRSVEQFEAQGVTYTSTMVMKAI
ncbi:hypothetical protein IC229_02785 [Spirosoma sp. BT702]|uniref:Lipocalin-like domain-containing protein n=1 Tax=Spirosoma profusum TaxID=2771354 RepID=A0A926Y0I6_9BACT|nr:hypothetical protein [Spirosoma profusum]MBD2699546.1 hypothetical protein [Spirosoma profusum]